MNLRKFNTEHREYKILNFSNNDLSKEVLWQLALDKKGKGYLDKAIIKRPAELKKEVDAEEYVHSLIEDLEWRDNYLVVLPGLSLLAGMICRALSEFQMPYQIINLVRDRDTGSFVIYDIY